MGFEDPSEATGTPEFIKSEFRRIRNQIRTGFRLFFHTNIEKLTVLYFGSFNPFHIGHASVAKFVAAQPWVEQLCFVLSPKNPLKESNTLQDANLRWEDLERVVRKLNGETTCREEKFSASDIEFHLEPPLYTYNTLEKLSALHPRRHFALLMGGDNINILHKWYRGEEILNRYPIIVYPREGVDTEAICNKKGAIYIDAPMVNISSTQIRTMMAAGEDVSELRY
jgi:nicotinate-nucleotide adenylyltransferase